MPICCMIFHMQQMARMGFFINKIVLYKFFFLGFPELRKIAVNARIYTISTIKRRLIL